MAINLILATLLGALLGTERSIAGKHAGMRTYALVSLGSCLFVVVEALVSADLVQVVGFNPLQIAGSIVIGIGFIGSGLSGFRGDHPSELTTASGIWLVAGIGMACGFGLYTLALTAALLGILIFSLLLKFENALRKKFGNGGD